MQNLIPWSIVAGINTIIGIICHIFAYTYPKTTIMHVYKYSRYHLAYAVIIIIVLFSLNWYLSIAYFAILTAISLFITKYTSLLNNYFENTVLLHMLDKGIETCKTCNGSKEITVKTRKAPFYKTIRCPDCK